MILQFVHHPSLINIRGKNNHYGQNHHLTHWINHRLIHHHGQKRKQKKHDQMDGMVRKTIDLNVMNENNKNKYHQHEYDNNDKNKDIVYTLSITSTFTVVLIGIIVIEFIFIVFGYAYFKKEQTKNNHPIKQYIDK